MIGSYYQHPFIPIPQKSTTHCPKASLVHGVLVCHWLIDNPVGISILKMLHNLMLHPTIYTQLPLMKMGHVILAGNFLHP